LSTVQNNFNNLNNLTNALNSEWQNYKNSTTTTTTSTTTQDPRSVYVNLYENLLNQLLQLKGELLAYDPNNPDVANFLNKVNALIDDLVAKKNSVLTDDLNIVQNNYNDIDSSIQALQTSFNDWKNMTTTSTTCKLFMKYLC
jgi:hypothetical protein